MLKMINICKAVAEMVTLPRPKTGSSNCYPRALFAYFKNVTHHHCGYYSIFNQNLVLLVPFHSHSILLVLLIIYSLDGVRIVSICLSPGSRTP